MGGNKKKLQLHAHLRNCWAKLDECIGKERFPKSSKIWIFRSSAGGGQESSGSIAQMAGARNGRLKQMIWNIAAPQENPNYPK